MQPLLRRKLLMRTVGKYYGQKYVHVSKWNCKYYMLSSYDSLATKTRILRSSIKDVSVPWLRLQYSQYRPSKANPKFLIMLQSVSTEEGVALAVLAVAGGAGGGALGHVKVATLYLTKANKIVSPLIPSQSVVGLFAKPYLPLLLLLLHGASANLHSPPPTQAAGVQRTYVPTYLSNIIWLIHFCLSTRYAAGS